MSDEKNLNEELEETTEEVVEATEEVTEEAVETVAEATEAVEEAVEAEVVEEAEAVAEDAAEAVEATVITDDAAKTSEKKPFPVVPVVVGAIIAVLVIVLVVLGITIGPKVFNKYNREGYVDVSGRTIAEVAESAGMDYADFLEEYGLPADMPGNTSESAAYYTIPCSRMAAMYGMDFETMKQTLEFPDTITEDSTWGEAEGEVRLSVYVGEDNLEAFKENYNLGDDVTGDTLWKEIRNTVDEYNRQQRIESEKAAAEESSSSVNDDLTSVTDADTTTDATPEATTAAE